MAQLVLRALLSHIYVFAEGVVKYRLDVEVDEIDEKHRMEIRARLENSLKLTVEAIDLKYHQWIEEALEVTSTLGSVCV